MGLTTSLLLIAVGAVLRWAITATVSGVNLHTVGLILIIIGAIGFLVSLFWLVTVSRRGGHPDGGYGGPVDGPTTTPTR